MYSFIEFHNAKEHSAVLSEINSVLERIVRDEKSLSLQEIFKPIGRAIRGIQQGLTKTGQGGADIGIAYTSAKYSETFEPR